MLFMDMLSFLKSYSHLRFSFCFHSPLRFAPKFNISNHPISIGQTALNYDFSFALKFTNSNDRLEFQMPSLHTVLGQANVEGFSQATGKVTRSKGHVPNTAIE